MKMIDTHLRRFRLALLGVFAGVLVLASTSATAANPGDPFRLGVVNTISAPTYLQGTVNGNGQLHVENSSTVNSSSAVLGRMASTSAGSYSAGLLGINASTAFEGYGVWGVHHGGGPGVYGKSNKGAGLLGEGVNGVVGIGPQLGIFGRAINSTGTGIKGSSEAGRGLEGSGGGIGVIGISPHRGVVGVLGLISCAGSYAVGGCAGATGGDGLLGQSSTGAGVRSITSSSGNLFVGESPAGTHRARINANGRGFFNGGTQNSGADYAESIPATGPATLEPGDVLAIDPREGYAVRKATIPNSQLVTGVYSSKPAVLAVGSHGIDDSLAGEVPVAMMGVAPTKVTARNGAIRAGDLLTSSSTPGYAMKARPFVVGRARIYPTGAILGKALAPLRRGTGVINVLVMLR
jgi:hypothetical protein